ncbi:MAG: type 1 glutamine amidotransferase [Solirubrobacterales bacterium]|nr:type 1 glutamine amidotransferase [Solirubrobacterales bacterium]
MVTEQKLDGKHVAFLFTDGVEQTELIAPLAAARAAGADTALVSLEQGPVQMFNHLDKAETIDAALAVKDTEAASFDALVLPGGVANPDALRRDPDAVRFIGGFFEDNKPVGAICHAPWTLVEADVLHGRTLTSWPSLKTDIENAGGHWVDENVHVDGGLISSRKPDDLPAFCSTILESFAQEPAHVGHA